MSLPGGGVGDQNPALSIRIFQDESGCSRKRTCSNPRSSLGSEIPTDREIMVRLFAGHEFYALLTENVLDMWHSVDAGDES